MKTFYFTIFNFLASAKPKLAFTKHKQWLLLFAFMFSLTFINQQVFAQCSGVPVDKVNNTAGCTDGPAYDTQVEITADCGVASIQSLGEITITLEKIDDAASSPPCNACQQLGGPGHQGGCTFNSEISIFLVNTCTGTTITLAPTGTWGGCAHGGIVTMGFVGSTVNDPIPGAGGTPVSFSNVEFDQTPLLGEIVDCPGGLVIRVLDSAGADPLCMGNAAGNNAVAINGECLQPPTITTTFSNGPFCVSDPLVNLQGLFDGQIPTNAAQDGTWNGPTIVDGTLGTGTFDPASAGVGTHTLTYVYNMGGDCDITLDHIVQVNDCGSCDLEDPLIICPTVASPYSVDAGECFATIASLLASATDNCPAAVTITNDSGNGTADAGGQYAVGIHTINFVAIDGVGNQSNCAITIEVIDDIAPSITCPTDIMVDNDPEVCGAMVTYMDPMVSDNCAVGTTGSPTTLTTTFAGGNGQDGNMFDIVALNDVTITGFEQNIELGTGTVEIYFKTGTHVGFEANAAAWTLLGSTSVTSAGTGGPTAIPLVLNVAIPAGQTYAFYVTTTGLGVDYTNGTGLGNVFAADANIQFLEGTGLGYAFTAAGGPFSPRVFNGIINYTPSIGGAIVVNLTSGLASDSVFPIGTTTNTFTTTDAGGNEATCSFDVTVTDVELPTIVCPADVIQMSCSGYVAVPLPTANDNCPATVINDYTGTFDASSAYPLGTTMVNWTITDDSGNTAGCSHNVVVNDDEPAVLVCPTNIEQPTDLGTCDALVDVPFLVGFDVCGFGGFTNDYNGTSDASDTYPVGATTVTFTASDESGNTSECSMTITISDEEAPGLTCPTDFSVNTDPGTCDAVATWAAPIASDNCGIATVVGTHTSGDTFLLGTTNVVYVATDVNGNETTCTFGVSVVDMEAPDIVCPSNVVESATFGGCDAFISIPAPVATDNCSIDAMINDYNGTQNATDTYPLGTTTINFTVTDDAGLTAGCSMLVVIVDDQAPDINCPSFVPSVSADADCMGIIPDLTADLVLDDNCTPDATIGVMQTPVSGSLVGIGNTIVNLVASDEAGNTSSCTVAIAVIDDIAPTITCPAEIMLDTDAGLCEAVATWADPIVSDNCGVATVVGSNTSGDAFSIGTTLVTYTVTDNAGLEATCSFKIEVTDNETPGIVCPSNVVESATFGGCDAFISIPAPVATDNCSIDAMINDYNGTQSATDTYPLGTTTINFTVTDDAGLTAGCSMSVAIVDDQAPTINCPFFIPALVADANCEGTVPDLTGGAVMGDNCTTNANLMIVQDPAAGDLVGLGTTIVTLTATDEAGNSAACTSAILVQDRSAPTIMNCPADIMVDNDPGTCFAVVTWTAPTASDNCGVTSFTSTHNSGDTFPLGVTTVTYTAVDAAGNVAECMFDVTVGDAEAGTIVCPANSMASVTSSCSAFVVVPSPTINDNCSNITLFNNITGGFAATGFYPVGTTTIIWVATDDMSNTASCTADVIVLDEIAPEIIGCPLDIDISNDEGDCSGTATWLAPSTIDNCNATIAGSHSSGDVFIVGSTTVTYVATDDSGNTAACTFSVNVTDDEMPSVTCPTTVVVGTNLGVCEGDATVPAPLVADNCAVDGFVNDYNGTSDATGTYALGTTLVTWTVMDIYENESSCTMNVVVEDTEAPTITCPANINTCELDGFAEFDPPVVSDNCGAFLASISHSSGSLFPVGVNTVTAIAEDDAGNTAACSFSITYSPLRASVTPSDYNGFGISCAGGNDGEATALATGGFPPFTYAWSDGQTTPTATGLTAGFYTVVITDQLGCVAQAGVILNQPAPVTCELTSEDVSCFGDTDGSATTSPQGGIGPYTYNWSGDGGFSATTAAIAGLAPGDYELTVTDSNGCTCTNTTTIDEPAEAILVGEGSVSEGTGGVSPFDYSMYTIEICGGEYPYDLEWDNTGYVRYAFVPTEEGCVNLNIQYIDGATWAVTITDTNQCGQGVLEFTNISDAGDPIMDIIDNDITGADGAADCTEGGAIDLTVQGGTPGYNYVWTGPDVWAGPTSGAGLSTITDLPSGWYAVTITDSSVPPQTTEGWYWVPCCEPGNGRGPCATTKTDVLGASQQLRAYPNPFAESTMLEFSLSQTEQATLSIYTIDGREVAQLFDGEAAAGEIQQVVFESGNLPADMYFAKLATNSGKVYYQKLVLTD